MERRGDSQLDRFRYARVQADTEALGKALKSCTENHRAAVEQYYQTNDLCFLQDREAELWLPLFAVCAVAAPEKLVELERVAKRLAEAKSSNEPADLGIHLLRDIWEVFAQQGADRLETTALLNRLNGLSESPWGYWFKGPGLTPHDLSRLLRPFNIHSQNIRCGERVVKGYMKHSLEDAWERYL